MLSDGSGASYSFTVAHSVGSTQTRLISVTFKTGKKILPARFVETRNNEHLSTIIT
jgi:hypothetical protein